MKVIQPRKAKQNKPREKKKTSRMETKNMTHESECNGTDQSIAKTYRGEGETSETSRERNLEQPKEEEPVSHSTDATVDDVRAREKEIEKIIKEFDVEANDNKHCIEEKENQAYQMNHRVSNDNAESKIALVRGSEKTEDVIETDMNSVETKDMGSEEKTRTEGVVSNFTNDSDFCKELAGNKYTSNIGDLRTGEMENVLGNLSGKSNGSVAHTSNIDGKDTVSDYVNGNAANTNVINNYTSSTEKDLNDIHETQNANKEETKETKETKEEVKNADVLKSYSGDRIAFQNGMETRNENEVKIYIHDIKNDYETEYVENYEFNAVQYNDKTRLSTQYGITSGHSISSQHFNESLDLNGNLNGNEDNDLDALQKNDYVSSVDKFASDNKNSIQSDMDNISSELLSNKHVETFNSLYNSSNYYHPSVKETELSQQQEQAVLPTEAVGEKMGDYVQQNRLFFSVDQSRPMSKNFEDFMVSASFDEKREARIIETNESVSSQWDAFRKDLEGFENDAMNLGKFQLKKDNISSPVSSAVENSLLQQNVGLNNFSTVSPTFQSTYVPHASPSPLTGFTASPPVTDVPKMESSHVDVLNHESVEAVTTSADPPTGIAAAPEKNAVLKIKSPQSTSRPGPKGVSSMSAAVLSKAAKTSRGGEVPRLQDASKTPKAGETNKVTRIARTSVEATSSYQRGGVGSGGGGGGGGTSIANMSKDKGLNRSGKSERHSIGNPMGSSSNISNSNISGNVCSSGGQDKDMTYNMNVVIRCRPMSASEKNEGAKNIIKVLDNKVVVLIDPADNTDNVLRQNRSREKKYAFDYAFDEQSTTQDVYDNSVKCLIDGVIRGYNSTVFAYGATGAGKTHTIIGYKDEPGIMMMILQDLFDKMKSLKVMNDYKVMCSFIEIYNENIVDLLNPSSEYLDLREDPVKGITVSNLFEVCTTSVEEIMELIHTGNKNRTQEPTDANKTSSRSHGILQIVVEETEKGQGMCQQIKRGKLCVIDLAGSERASQTNNKGIRMLEGANINRSLLALGNVINALVLRSKGTSKSNFIPFRDSKLTRLLKDSLGGNCRTVMIANISPSHLSYEDTHNTLKYANRAKNIKSVVTSNAVAVKHHLSMYVEIIEKLKREIEYLKEQLNEREKMQANMGLGEMARANSNQSNYSQDDFLSGFEERDYSKEELVNIFLNLRKENQQLKMYLQNNSGGKLSEEQFYDCNTGTSDHIGGSDGLNTSMNACMNNEEILKYKTELENVKIINEKLFSDNKNFQNKLQECSHIIKQFQMMNEDYKKQIMEYKRQIDEFKMIMHNHDVNHIQMKKQLDHLKKKYIALQENKTDAKEYDEMFEKWRNDITMLLNERKEIKNIIFDVEKKLIENNELGHNKLSIEDVNILKGNKIKMDHQLKENIAQTNSLMKELPSKVKDEKMKNFLYLYYTNKVLIQEKEELQVNNKKCEQGKVKYTHLKS